MAACSLVSRPKAEHVARRYLIRDTQLTIISQMLANAVLGLLGYTYRGILVIRKKLILFRFRETWIWEIYSPWLVTWRFCVTSEEPDLLKDNPPWFYHSILRDFKTQVLQMVRVVYRKCTAQKPKYSRPNSLECGSRPHCVYYYGLRFGILIIYNSNIFESPSFSRVCDWSTRCTTSLLTWMSLNTKRYIKCAQILENRTLWIRKLDPIKYFLQPKKSCVIKNEFYPGNIPTTA